MLKGIKQDVKIYCIISHGLPKTDITKVTSKLEKDVKTIWLNQKFIFLAMIVLFFSITSIFYIVPREAAAPSIGILPFKKTCKQEDFSYWEKGYYEDLIIKFANAGNIKVSKIRPELFEKMTNTQIAKQLEVKYILEPSICRENEKIELRYSLVDIKINKTYANKLKGNTKESHKVLNKIVLDVVDIMAPNSQYAIHQDKDVDVEALKLYYFAKPL